MLFEMFLKNNLILRDALNFSNSWNFSGRPQSFGVQQIHFYKSTPAKLRVTQCKMS